MSAASRKRKISRKTSQKWDRYLLVMLGCALVVLTSFIWYLVRHRESDVDFGVRLLEMAAARGAGPDRIAADQPIRKVDDRFVRSWQIATPNRAALEALAGDIVAEATLLRGAVSEGPELKHDTGHLQVEFETEVFDIQLVVAAPRRQSAREPTPVPTEPPPPTATPRPEPGPGDRGRLAILLDDAGQSVELVPLAATLPVEVAVAVMPFLPYSSEVAAEVHRSGHEVWLHLPMEPEGYPATDPGLGAVLVEMPESEIRATVHAALNNVPHAVGVNNHMGSRATAHLRTMTWVMQELKVRGMAFIDSRTTPETVAEYAARSQGVPSNRRHVFLDNDRSARAIRKQLAEAIYRSRLEGEVIAIGHLTEVTVKVLAGELPGISERGADLVAPSALVR
jgi:polysaccharide deacetylase 2 family uncharacterized protein YibQ